MSEEKGIRLSKIAKELSVGTNTIIEFLAAKGHKIDHNPNTKISEELQRILLKEFQADKSAKEESLVISKLKERETVELEVEETYKPTPKVESEQKEILIKNISSVPFEEKKEAKKEVKKVEKVKEVKEVKKEETPEDKSPKVEPQKQKPEEDEVIKAKAEQIEGPTVLGKIDLSAINSRTKPDKKKKLTKKEKEKALKEEKEKEKEKEETIAATVASPEEITPVAEIPAQETPVEEPPVVEVAPEPELPIEKEKEEPFRMEREVLQGPTVLGRIELPVDPPKRKPVASSNVSAPGEGKYAKKKKRKRKQFAEGGKPVVDAQRQGQGQSHPQGQGQTQGHGQTHGQGQGQAATRPTTGFRGKPFARPAPVHKAEPTDKEIQDQIKATLARLSGVGKSRGAKHRKLKREGASQLAQEMIAEQEAQKSIIKVAEYVSANELAQLMSVPVTQVISSCMSLGLFVSINQRLDAETITVVADEFGFSVEFITVEAQADEEVEAQDKAEDLVPRPPIVTVMGHVDHGKTSLLDYVRKTNVIAGEAGGITQHIGAYEVTLESGKQITFLDTPGHEAFTAMRARGAKVTDVAIIVIAADDSVMPQTVEAINHAQAAGVPIVFAINKIDKPQANPEKIKEQLSQMNILVEEWGGKYQSHEIAAKKGTNVFPLLEKVLLEAEMLDLKANPNKRAIGTVIESSLDKGRGYVTTVLVQAGTLKIGEVVLAGCHSGRVKAMFNERGGKITEAGPSTPVLLLGMDGAPQAGDTFKVMDDERKAREIANKRMQLQREQGIRTRKHITLDEIGRRLAIGNFKELNIIVKGDVDGSIEALSDTLLKLSTKEIQVNVIHKSVGQISESDVLLASASNAIIIGFQVRPSLNARKLAEQEQIDIRLYSIIYDAINEIKLAMEGMLAPEFEEKIVCNIEIREVFKVTKVGTVAGCMVIDGKVNRQTKIRIIREGIVVFSGELASLKRFKDDVKEVTAGYECGLNINNFNDIKAGDIIEGYEQVAIKRKL